MTKRNIWYAWYSKSHDFHGIIPCKSMYLTLHFDTMSRWPCASPGQCSTVNAHLQVHTSFGLTIIVTLGEDLDLSQSYLFFKNKGL